MKIIMSLDFPTSCNIAVHAGSLIGADLMPTAIEEGMVTTSQEALAFLTATAVFGLKAAVDSIDAPHRTADQKRVLLQDQIGCLIQHLEYARLCGIEIETPAHRPTLSLVQGAD